MASIPHPKNPSAKTTDDKNKGQLTAQNLSQSDKLNGKAANYFFWPILASGINLIVNLVAAITEDFGHGHLYAVLISFAAIGILFFTEKLARRGRLISALGIMSVVTALESIISAAVTSFGGIVTVFTPILAFVLILPVLQSKMAQRLAFFNSLITVIVATLLIFRGAHDESDNYLTVFMLVAGVTIILIGVFRVLTQHQFFMTKAISDLQISNQSRGELAKQLRLQSEKLQERSSRLETLNDVTQNVMRQLTMDDMLSYIMRRAADLVQANHTSVLLQDREGENLIIHYGTGLFRALRGNRLTKFDNNLAIHVWQTGKTEVINDYAHSAYRASAFSQYGLIAVCVTPLIHNKKVIGVLEFANNRDGAYFSDEHVTLLNQLSHLASIAYANSALYAQVQTERDVARRVMKTMGQGLSLIGKNGNINYVNPALTSLLGYHPDELVGQPFDNLFAEEQWADQPRYQRTHQSQAFSGQYLLRRKDGTTVPSLISYPPQMVESLLDETVCVFTDLTQIKSFQDKMKEARDQALHMVELKTGFLATVSHELRTPLHSIEGYLELLLDTRLDEEQKSYAQTAFDASVNLNEIINEVLDFSKLEGKAMQLQLAAGSVKAVLETVVATLNSKAMQKNLFLNFDVTPQVPQQLMIDSQRLRQILLNLAGNAIKFTQEGGVQIRVQPQSVTDGAITLLFSVIDTGIGISKNDQERIFQPFMQADSTATRSFGGTGLGLAIVKSLVELMGGEVGVQSETGKGSRFWFTVVAPIIVDTTRKPIVSDPIITKLPPLPAKDHSNRLSVSAAPATITDIQLIAPTVVAEA